VVFNDILWPLASLWNHSSILDRVIEQTILFTAEVGLIVLVGNDMNLKCFQAYPAIYSWTSYPLTALIEVNFEHLQKLERKKVPNTTLFPSLVGVTEVIACAERALNFLHTGNQAVIMTSVMNPLWIGRSIIVDGSPCFNPAIVKADPVDQVKVKLGDWPYDDARRQPKSTSGKTLRHRYGEQCVAVRVLVASNKALADHFAFY
jgi:hypothetical protein